MKQRPADASDAELLGSSLAGDVKAFTAVIARHETGVHGYLARRAGYAAAEDLLSEVWLAAFRARGSYDPSWPNARPWLFGIARNILRTHQRRDHRNLPAASGVLDLWPEVDERLEGAALVKAAVLGLPVDERDVLLLVVWEQLTPTEAAIVLGIPSGTARGRLHRARIAIRGDLAYRAEAAAQRSKGEAS
ncbi:MAG TPA: sigma-70 family RNA polymerase sigma factor [Acidimicrobiales bacterium]|jgi:RNA polymerase sigma-70 factor (ECF subfamily)|nr:sigma-70 family RNA polymerase sigma factor [Acidimicrobiales bacterium]